MDRAVNRQWRLARRPVGRARAADFEWRERPVPDPGPGQVLVHNRFLSLDTIVRAWMREESTFLPRHELGDVIRGIALGRVVRSRAADLPEGTTVMGEFGWQDFAIAASDAAYFLPLAHDGALTPAMQLALFGPASLSAYFAITEVARPRAGEITVVSAAGGAAGSLAGQIAKLQGSRAIGITSSADKCRWLTQELGFDAAIDAHREPVFRRLRELCPQGIDVYFDSVGGSLLEDVLDLLRPRARVALCGMISAYNDIGIALAQPPGPNNLLNLVYRGAGIQGVSCLAYWPRAHEAVAALSAWHAQGKLHCRTELAHGLVNAPRLLDALFQGRNHGKLVLEI